MRAAPPPVLPALPGAGRGDDGEGAGLGVTPVLVQPTTVKLLHPQPQPRPQHGVQHADTVHLKVVLVVTEEKLKVSEEKLKVLSVMYSVKFKF